MVLPLSTGWMHSIARIGSAFISPQADLLVAIYLDKLHSDSVWYQSFSCADKFAGRIGNDKADGLGVAIGVRRVQSVIHPPLSTVP